MILCYGSLNPDLIHFVERLPGPADDLRASEFTITYGGGAANVAVCLARWDGRAQLAGNTLGTDPLATWLIDDLEDRAVDTSLVERSETSGTPHTVVLITPDAERTIIGSGYDMVTWSQVSDQVVRSSDVVLVDGYAAPAAAHDLLDRATRLNTPTVGMDVAADLADMAELVVWSKHEHDTEEAQRIAQTGSRVVLTNGPHPIRVWSDGETWSQSPPPIEARNTLGAGDAVAAMCALGLARRWPLPETVALAAAAGALTAGVARGDPAPDLPHIRKTVKTMATERDHG